jgi:hypothetical protein
MSDYKGAALMIDAFPKAKACWVTGAMMPTGSAHALAERGITPCIPSKSQPQNPIPHDRTLYRQRHRIENMFGKTQGLAPHPHPLRPMRAHLHVRHLHRRNRHLLAQSMSPEPSCPSSEHLAQLAA